MTSFVAIFAGHVASLLEFFGLEFFWPVLFVLEICAGNAASPLGMVA